MTPCIRCGAAGSHVLHPLELVACSKCLHAWLAEAYCSMEAVEAVVGKFHVNQTGGYSEHIKRFDAELERRTLAWAKSSREAA